MNSEPRQILQIRSKYRMPAFRAVVDIAMEDPVLAQHVNTWRSLEGFDTDVGPATVGMMPLLSFSMAPMANVIEAIDLTKVNFVMMVQVFVQGTCLEDTIALWEAIEDAYIRSKPFRDTTVGDYLCKVIRPGPSGLIRFWPSGPAIPVVDLNRPNNNPEYQSSVGTLHGFILRPA